MTLGPLVCPTCYWSGREQDLDAHDVVESRAPDRGAEYFCPACGRHLIAARASA